MKFLRGPHADFRLLALLTLPAVFALLLNAGLPNTADGVLHLYRTVELDRAWRDGVFFPRIAPDFAYGYGYPIFNYYAPAFYWLAELPHLLGLNFEWAFKLAVVAICYSYPLGMWLFARRLLPRGAALVAAVAYLYAPYRFYEAYIQGDYPQFLALAIVPFCLWAWTPRAGKVHVLTGLTAYAALLLAHNITALIATPFIGAYLLFALARLTWGDGFAPRAGIAYAAQVGASIALAVGVSAFFWLPALGEQQYVRIERLTQGFFHFENYFLTPAELLSPNIPPDLAGVNPYIPFNLGPVVLMLALLGLLLMLLPRWRARVSRAAQLFFAASALALALMTLPVTTPLWEHLPLLKLTEFPWRFVGVAALPLAMLVGFAAAHLHALSARLLRIGTLDDGRASLLVALLVALVALDSFVYLFPRTPFLQYGNPSLADIVNFELSSQALGTTSAGEYLPLWTQRRMYTSPLVAQLQANRVPDHLQREALPVTVRVTPLAQTVERDMYRVESAAPLTLHLQRIYFPGWTARIDGQPVPLELVAPTGTMQVVVPAGTHVVDFQFGATRLRAIANGIALVSLGAMAFVALWLWRRAPRAMRAMNAERPTPRAGYALFAAAAALITFYFVAPRLGYVRYSLLPTISGLQHPRSDTLGEEMRLLGYDLSAAHVSAGDALALTLYWQPLRVVQKEYAVFVHLDNPLTLETVAQTINAHPGNISTVELPLSLFVRDPHVLRVPAHVEPGLYWLRVGMLDTRTDQALPVVQPDGSRRTRVLLQTVRVRRTAPVDLSAVTRTQVRIGPAQLLGYTLDGPSLTLYWRAAQTSSADATIFVHLLDEASRTIATFDGPPAGGLLPLSAWEPDEIVVDRRALIMDQAGTFRIVVGLYDPQTLQRYPAHGADGQRLPDDQFTLDATVRR